MPSAAYEHLEHRMRDIEQLMEAHTALTQFQRARRAAEQAGGDLARISHVVSSLVTEPGPGRRREVDALNRAAIVLLSSHLQGYIEDVYTEAARILLQPSLINIDTLIEQTRSRFSNPHAYRIDRLFASISLPKITGDLSWQRASNKSVKSRLSRYIYLRNSIAHGSQEQVTKQKVLAFKRFVEVFARNFDARMGSELQAIDGAEPW